MEGDDRLTLDPSDQHTLVQEVEPVLEIGPLSSSHSVDWENLARSELDTGKIADASASIEPDLPLATQETKEQEATFGGLTTKEAEHEFIENVLNSEVLHELHYAETPARISSSELQPDSRFSSTIHPYRLSLLPEEMQPPGTTIPLRPLHESETIRHYLSGQVYPISYLARLRRQVDSTFSKDDWGDEYYFSDSHRFWYVEDDRQSPHNRLDRRATRRGLELRARKIPERAGGESWKSFEESMGRLASGEGNDMARSLKLEEMQQGIEQRTKQMKPLPLFKDLQPSVQQQKTIHGWKAMQGISVDNLVAPVVSPSRFSTAPFTKRRLSCDGRIEKGRPDRNARPQQWLRTTGRIPDDRLKGVSPVQ